MPQVHQNNLRGEAVKTKDWVIVISIIAVIVMLAMVGGKGDTWADRTAERLEARDCGFVESGGGLAGGLMGVGWVRDERFKNMKKNVLRLVEITKDIEWCDVGKTGDTQEWVITLARSDGKCVSLWLQRDGKVRTITPY